jgi:glycopeptide antibiotics resistance protein
VLGARQYGWLALGFLALALYGSFVPFHFRPLALSEAVSRFQAVCATPVRVESRSDWLANILLFIPLSFLWMAALCVDRPRWAGLIAALVVLPACAALSATIEFTQLFFPPRVSSLNDVVAESIGGVLGTLAWLAWGQRITGWARRVWGAPGSKSMAARLLPGYLAYLVLVHVLPLDLTISPVEIYHKYREGRVTLAPFTSRYADGFEMAQKNLMNVIYFLPIGLLLAHFRGRTWQCGRCWARVLGLGLAVAGTIEFLQLFVVSRSFDATDIVTGALAVLAGWGGVLVYRRLRPESSAAPGRRLSVLRLIGLTAWLAVLVFLNWQPFDFTPEIGLDRLGRVPLVPFVDYYEENYIHAFDQFLQKTFLFVPLGALLTPVDPRPKRGILFPVLGAALVATTLEAGQLFLPTRVASVTDVLVESFGAWLGIVLIRRFRLSLAAERALHAEEANAGKRA